MKILLSNDDGIQAPGLRALYYGLRNAGHDVHVVAPVTEQSAVGHALTVFSPLKVKEFRENSFRGLGVHGTPVDCVKFGLSQLPVMPDMVVSGINAGANVGPDIVYSGTVSAATEGAFMGLPSLAVSFDSFNVPDISDYGAYVASLLPRLPWDRLAKHTLLNLNLPDRPLADALPLKVCPLTDAYYRDGYEKRSDPRGQTYYWLSGQIPSEKISSGSDRQLLTEGHITLTPIRFDLTDRNALAAIEGFSGNN